MSRTALLIALSLAGARALAAQDAALLDVRGVVLDAAGEPVTRTPVMLHRMSEAEGGLLAADTTDAEGRFAFSVPAGADEALHFAAASAGGALFVGPVLGAGREVPDPYVIRVREGVAQGSIVLEDGSVLSPDAFGAAAPAAAAAAASGERDSRRVALVFLGVAFLLAAGALHVRERSRERAMRKALVELAELRAAEASPTLDERRAELRERAHALRPR